MIEKQAILEGVIEEFNEKGLKFTMDQLAKRLGISKKTLYQFFGDKESLFLEAMDECFCAIKQSERKIIEDPNMDLIEKIRKVIIVLPEKYAKIDFRKLSLLNDTCPKVFEKVAARIENDWEPTLNLMRQAIAEGLMVPINLCVFQTMISASIEAFLKSNVLIEQNVSYQEALEQMITITLDGLLCRK